MDQDCFFSYPDQIICCIIQYYIVWATDKVIKLTKDKENNKS